ncbi:hypothetical protein DC094_01590 [Pelagibaculum spongiae]|uniref:Uncharacterized protein n=1 Tax=Pelagibaculum spongiae TaxID=2080658 RepID=A0A2V1GY90_9GAMM|nr:hypothetical protein DC094_01590 [Pelagibaculum spongiae]
MNESPKNGDHRLERKFKGKQMGLMGRLLSKWQKQSAQMQIFSVLFKIAAIFFIIFKPSTIL